MQFASRGPRGVDSGARGASGMGRKERSNTSRPPCAQAYRCRYGRAAYGFVLAAIASARAQAITISEIHYDPPGEAAGLEFVEIHNDSATVSDVSGWSFTEGIQFTFPPGSFIPGRGYVTVCADDAAFRAANPGVVPAGVFAGRLESTGESLVLSNRGGGEAVRIRYSDRGKWPSEPAGTGHTLSLRRPHLAPSEPESWAPSTERGGTPGRPNFPDSGSDLTEIVPARATWRYRKGTAEFSQPDSAWRQRTFDASAWSEGTAGIGYADGDDSTDISDMQEIAGVQPGYPSIAMRRVFTISTEAIMAMDGLVLGVNYDDGFVAYLNGVEVARASMPGNPGDPVPFSTLAVVHEAGLEELFEISKGLLTAGDNVLAFQGHNTALTSSDFSLHPRLLARRTLRAAERTIAFNELFGRTSGSRWLELTTTGPVDVDLAGYLLTAAPDASAGYRLPAESEIPAGGFLVVSEAASGLVLSTPEVKLFLWTPAGDAVVCAEIFENVPDDSRPASRDGMSDARFPDGVGEFAFAAEPTPGLPNSIEAETGIVINEIFYNPPLGHTAGEFLELYNRGPDPVDLGGWAITRGIDFTFPDGTTLASSEFLVLGSDPPALEALYGLSGVLGPWVGALADGGEAIRLVDTFGNIADEVRYHDGGDWPSWPDGGGSSLELSDPLQDNSFASAWASSDESGESAWTFFSYTASYNPEGYSEIHFLLLDEGVVLLDDISLRRQGSADEYIPNGGFETGTAPWLIGGTHVASRRTTADAHTGSACLELIASGEGDDGVNKLDTDTSPGMTAGTYTLSFWAKWIRGADKLLTRADSRTGAPLSRIHQLALPPGPGSPGRENGARAALPGGNLGPVMAGAAHQPVVPGAGSPVTIVVRASDSDGIASVEARYRTGGIGDGVFGTAALLDDGLSGDGKAADGIFAGIVPGFALGTKVIFYIEAADTLGAVRTFPVEAPARTLLYVVESRQPSPLDVVRLNIDDDNESRLVNRPLHSDELVAGTFVFNDEEVYYNVGVRYRGSPWNRPPDPKMFRVRFPDDRPFIHDLKAINLSRYGWAQNEGAAYFCVQSAGLPHSPGPVGEYLYAHAFKNGAFHAQMALVEPVNSGYLEKWFPSDPDGYLFKIPARRFMNDEGVMEGADFTTFAFRAGVPGAPYEPYRWYFIPQTNVLENRWSDLNAVCAKLDVSRTSTPVFDAEIEDVLDVEQFLRVEAARVLQDDWDTIGIGNGQNAYFYFAPLEGRGKLLPWDMDHTFGNTGAKLFPEGSEAQITRLIQRPQFRRMYLRIVDELLQTAWDPQYIAPFLSQTQAVMGGDGNGILNFIIARRPSVVAQVPTSAPFRITHVGSNAVPADWDGKHVTVRTSERLRGSAPIRMSTLAVLREGEDLGLRVTWISTPTWQVDVPLVSGKNEIEILGLSDGGGVEGRVVAEIVSTSGWAEPVVTSVTPDTGSSLGGTAVRIGGSGFQDGAEVFFGAAPALATTVRAPDEIEAVSPPGTGQVPIVVENIDEQRGSIGSGFTYIDAVTFIRGDATRDGRLDISDAVKILGYLFLGEAASCLDACDVDDSGSLEITDPVALLNFLFLGDQPPAAPHPDPGPDSSVPDLLGCDA